MSPYKSGVLEKCVRISPPLEGGPLRLCFPGGLARSREGSRCVANCRITWRGRRDDLRNRAVPHERWKPGDSGFQHSKPCNCHDKVRRVIVEASRGGIHYYEAREASLVTPAKLIVAAQMKPRGSWPLSTRSRRRCSTPRKLTARALLTGARWLSASTTRATAAASLRSRTPHHTKRPSVPPGICSGKSYGESGYCE